MGVKKKEEKDKNPLHKEFGFFDNIFCDDKRGQAFLYFHSAWNVLCGSNAVSLDIYFKVCD